MRSLSRRSFVGWLSAIAGAIGLRPRVAESATRTTVPGALQDARNAALLAALAQTVLPTELGSDVTARIARDFSRWSAGHREGAEVLHPYGSAELSVRGPIPSTEWGRQLLALDAESTRRFGRRFSALDLAKRDELVRASLQGLKITGMPAALSAPHVALALLARFYESPEATDLCYRARIAREQCRPLANASRQPLPLATRPGGQS
jgi:hypothetical protein